MPFSDPERAERWAFLAAAAAVMAAFVWFVLRPLAAPLVFAVLTAVIANPLHRRIAGWVGGRRVPAALLTTLALTLLVGLPAVGLGTLFALQLQEVVAQLVGQEAARSRLVELANQYVDWASQLAEAAVGDAVDVRAMLQESLRKGAEGLYALVPNLVGGAGRLAFGILLLYLVLFVLLLRGPELLEMVIQVLPIGESRSRRILRRLERTVQGVFLGSLATALIQGTVAGVGFWLLGFQNQLVWAVLIAGAGLIPIVGTALILVPATLYLAVTGQGPAALAMAVIALVVGTVDNLVKPLLIHERAAVHPLLVFIGIFGGLSTLGGMGLLYGPLLVACLTEMIRIYRQEFSRKPGAEPDLSPGPPGA